MKENKVNKTEALQVKIDGLEVRIKHLETENSDLQGALAGATRMAESLRKDSEGMRKDVEEWRAKNTMLREQLSRTLGYIDRVVEDDRPPQPANVIPEQLQIRSRGPNLNQFLHDSPHYNDIGAGMANACLDSRRRY